MGVVVSDSVHLHVGPLGSHELLIDEAAAASDFVLLGVELGALVADLAEQTLGPAARAARIVDPHVVIFRVHGFLDKRFRNLLAVAHDVVLELLKLARGPPFVAVAERVARNRDARGEEEVVDVASVEHLVLDFQIVEEVHSRVHFGVFDGLLEREAIGVEGDKSVAERPLLDGFVQENVVPKLNHDKVSKCFHPFDQLAHRFALNLFVHGTQTDADWVMMRFV
mmetsp:Transcript_27504/g.65203  ORF Transcript_27504/g.65203 Transcript_27504/m.65203 type:complete len:224 (-) Transcript_27504:89-760(-)